MTVKLNLTVLLFSIKTCVLFTTSISVLVAKTHTVEFICDGK